MDFIEAVSTSNHYHLPQTKRVLNISLAFMGFGQNFRKQLLIFSPTIFACQFDTQILVVSDFKQVQCSYPMERLTL